VNRELFRAPTPTGNLVGWVTGEGPPVLALHGGPGLSFDYLDPLVDELATEFRVATFQQRGLTPSTTSGPFTVAQAVTDVAAVLDALEWDRTYVVGHSWGGHLAFHVAHDLAPRLIGVLAVEPLGAVGDGGASAFGAEMVARLRDDVRARAIELDARDDRGEATDEEALEALALFWPGYFADSTTAPAMPPMRTNRVTSGGLWTDLRARLPELEAGLSEIDVPVGVLVGGRSPMPPSEAGVASAKRIRGAWSVTVANGGHFIWVEAPGCVLDAMRRLASGAPAPLPERP
jgi:pimeloyl-ACP methyl ester carboxylesterase